MISELLVNLGCLSINSFIEWMTTSLVPLVKVQAGNIRYKASLYNTSNFRHLTKSWIIYVQPQRIFQIPFHETMIKGMKDSADEHCLAIHTWEQILVFLKLRKEDGSYWHDEVDKFRILYEVHDLCMLPNISSNAMIEALDEWFLWLQPAW